MMTGLHFTYKVNREIQRINTGKIFCEIKDKKWSNVICQYFMNVLCHVSLLLTKAYHDEHPIPFTFFFLCWSLLIQGGN